MGSLVECFNSNKYISFKSCFKSNLKSTKKIKVKLPEEIVTLKGRKNYSEIPFFLESTQNSQSIQILNSIYKSQLNPKSSSKTLSNPLSFPDSEDPISISATNSPSKMVHANFAEDKVSGIRKLSFSEDLRMNRRVVAPVCKGPGTGAVKKELFINETEVMLTYNDIMKSQDTEILYENILTLVKEKEEVKILFKLTKRYLEIYEILKKNNDFFFKCIEKIGLSLIKIIKKSSKKNNNCLIIKYEKEKSYYLENGIISDDESIDNNKKKKNEKNNIDNKSNILNNLTFISKNKELLVCCYQCIKMVKESIDMERNQ